MAFIAFSYNTFMNAFFPLYLIACIVFLAIPNTIFNVRCNIIRCSLVLFQNNFIKFRSGRTNNNEYNHQCCNCISQIVPSHSNSSLLLFCLLVTSLIYSS
ncbi:hypothetical protein AAHE18_07G197100 [Arachis hypogaea]|nr:uncharacterized protein DS421_7g222530 [Arachis hypogaea]